MNALNKDLILIALGAIAWLVLGIAEFDGYRWAICARGSWAPLMVFQSLGDARGAL